MKKIAQSQRIGRRGNGILDRVVCARNLLLLSTDFNEGSDPGCQGVLHKPFFCA